MREIKLRAWDKKLNVMYEGIELSKLLGYLMFQPVPNSMAYVAMQDHFSDIIWLQYTGLKDKNGKEIYESDIISCDGRCGKVLCEVIYEAPVFQFLYKENDEFGRSKRIIRSWGDMCDVKVVGNIYENPEKMKGENNE